MSESLLQQGIAAARAGKRELARRILTTVIQQEPGNEQGWLWLSGVVDDPARAAYCLQRVLAINPQNAQAHAGLRWAQSRLQRGSTQPPFASATVTPPAQPWPSGSDQPAETSPLAPAEQLLAADSAPPPLPDLSASARSRRTPLPASPSSSALDDLRSVLTQAPAASSVAPKALAPARTTLRLEIPAVDDATRDPMTLWEAAGYTALLGAVVGLNVTLWVASATSRESFWSSLVLAIVGALVFALLMLPAWAAMAGALGLLAKEALSGMDAFRVAAASLLPGFLSAAAFLSGAARFLVPGLGLLLQILQIGLLILALIAIPVTLYKELRHFSTLNTKSVPTLVGAATIAALLAGSLGALLGSAILGAVI